AAAVFLSFASSCLIAPPLLILANITLNLSKSLSDALLFWTISFLPHELFSHFTTFILTSLLHSLNQSCLLRDTFDVNLDVGQGKPLEVDLAPDHVRSIHKRCLPGSGRRHRR
ncbi:hypothetical protein EE612_012464, partial [Oryza sativa]